MNGWELPPAQGLYDPAHEHDACGVGFVVDIKGRVSRSIVAQSLLVLKNLLHRGACGCETNTGDGAGILVQMPHKFLHRAGREAGLSLPEPGEYGTGIVFLPRHRDEREQCEKTFKRIIAEEGQSLIGWRDLPTDDSPIGPSAQAAEPHIRQIFVGRSKKISDPAAFERKLYVIRKRVEHAVWNSEMPERKRFYLPSLSARTLIYKGMLSADQIETMFPDITAPDFESALALVHQRFSTNTFPSWPLAHPYRIMAHNGEINTLRGNINRMHAREELCASPFLPEMKKILPIVIEGGSDSAIFDNMLEFLVMAGRPLPHAVMMMIPEPWSGHETMSPEKRAFYEYHSCLMEPWDGPASIAFSDGEVIGAVLDRNGLRPSRYWVTKDGIVVMASEVGVLDIPPENILLKERLHPGRMFLVDTKQGRIVADEEIKHRYASEHPYGEWLKTYLLPLEKISVGRELPPPNPATLLERQQAFGYTLEDLRLILGPMAENKAEPVGSMGTDTSLAVLSNRSRLLYDYFKQLFAQVTNPPLDAIREELVTQMSINIGPEGNLLDPQPESCQQIKLNSPILENEEMAKLYDLNLTDLKSKVLPILFPVCEGAAGLAQAMEDLCNRASQAIDSGYNILILSDRGVNRDMAPIPALLATSGVHQHLVRAATRTTVGLVVETGEAREVHHCALLIGYGASAINPYLAFETLDGMIRQGALSKADHATAVHNYVKALNKGILKVMSKMGISTVQSYCGAQIFEGIGLREDFVDQYFTGTASRVEGIGLDVIAEEVLLRHQRAYPERPVREPDLDPGGEYQWRRDGEYHLFNPETVFKLQHATRTGQWKVFKEYSALVDNQSKNLATLRGLMDLKYAAAPILIDEVEPVETILMRFATGAMSYGSISLEAHETLAIAMNRMGAKSNTGEGGEDPARYVPDPNGDFRRSAVKQVASARFGVTSEYLVNATDLQIKMAQGAKPGEGGQLPGGKVYPWIAKVRYSTPGVGLISPPPHHDIYSIEDLAQLIYDLKNSNPEARVHVKLVAEIGVGTVAAGVSKAHADVVLISGHDGGTGASPLTSIKYGGAPWELGLAETQQVLVM
ncbi:MAG: glutamate synthase large subunit, partial [Acidobacteria bacterium]|nr:glutamate synthase large subunit [Acidobacteriota bacterium]